MVRESLFCSAQALGPIISKGPLLCGLSDLRTRSYNRGGYRPETGVKHPIITPGITPRAGFYWTCRPSPAASARGLGSAKKNKIIDFV